MRSLERFKPLSLLFLRVALGVIFIYHGYPKLFEHTRTFIEEFVGMGLPGYFAYIAGVVEFFGGCMLIVGLFTRIAGLLLAAEMVVAVWKVGRIVADPLAVHNYETPLAILVGAFALATLGAGVLSLDHALFRETGSPGRQARKA